MILENKGEYIKDITPDDAIRYICEQTKVGLIAALAERIDVNTDHIISMKADLYERLSKDGDIINGVKMAVSCDPVVRCKECKWLRYCETEELDLYLDCDKPDGGGIPRNEEWFCADGEREGE